MTSQERIEREGLGYGWSDWRENVRLERLFSAWSTVYAESSFPLAHAMARHYSKKINRTYDRGRTWKSM